MHKAVKSHLPSPTKEFGGVAVDQKNENSKSHVLSAICGDLFSLASYLRESKSPDRSDKLYNGILDLFTTMEKRAREESIPEVDILKAKHAIVALFDEALRWESRLERKYFDSMVAGDEFFDRLEEMIKQSRGAEVPYNILEIYYICLTLGFSGRHIGDSETLQEYIRKLQEILGIRSPGELSPNGKRPSEEIKKQRSKIPVWLVYAVIGGSVLLIIIIFILLKINIVNWAVKMVNRIHSFMR